jgi:dTMP kinase
VNRTGESRSIVKACSNAVLGLFFTFEGPEGSGKSTQIALLAARLSLDGIAVRTTREPGGTAIGERIREILLARDANAMTPMTEALLLTAARSQHVAQVIWPALEAGELVLCDRFVDSTLAYQGGGRGLPLEHLRDLQRIAIGDFKPDLRLLLDLNVHEGLARRRADSNSTNRIDDEAVAFHERVRAAFLALAAAEPGAWRVINAERGVEAVSDELYRSVREIIERSGRHR